jgi:hypothetical protein
MFYYKVTNRTNGDTRIGSAIVEQTPNQILTTCNLDPANHTVERISYNEFQSEMEKVFTGA